MERIITISVKGVNQCDFDGSEPFEADDMVVFVFPNENAVKFVLCHFAHECLIPKHGQNMGGFDPTLTGPASEGLFEQIILGEGSPTEKWLLVETKWVDILITYIQEVFLKKEFPDVKVIFQDLRNP